MTNKIKILNPAHPGGSITSRKRAERYVRRGVAKWAGAESISFIADDHRHVSALSATTKAQIGYDQIGRMTLDQVQGLPVCGPAIKCFTLLSKRGPGYRVL